VDVRTLRHAPVPLVSAFPPLGRITSARPASLITPKRCGDARHHLARTRVYGGLMPREQRLRVVLLVAAAIIVAASIVATVATSRLYLMGFCGLVALVLLPLSLRRR
jgi:hypothetical protein